MKKIMFVMPLLALSLLACNNGGGDKPKPTEYTLTVTCDNGLVSGNQVQYVPGTSVALTFEANPNYVLPASVDDFDEVTGIDISMLTYDNKTGSLTFTMPANAVIIKLTATEQPEPPATEYTLTVTCDNGTVSGNLSPYVAGASVALTFEANPNYVLPASVDDFDEVTGIDISMLTYDNKTGSLTFTMPANAVIIKLTATEQPEPPATESWTLKLDNDSTKYGDLQYKTQAADSIIIDNFIGVKTPITMTFYS